MVDRIPDVFVPEVAARTVSEAFFLDVILVSERMSPPTLGWGDACRLLSAKVCCSRFVVSSLGGGVVFSISCMIYMKMGLNEWMFVGIEGAPKTNKYHAFEPNLAEQYHYYINYVYLIWVNDPPNKPIDSIFNLSI